jgi:hypothetical protein
MATIDNKEMIAKLLKNNGRYPGDPQMAVIYSYVNAGNGELMGAVYYPGPNLSAEIFELLGRPFVFEAKILWTKERGLSASGKEWIEEHGTEKE